MQCILLTLVIAIQLFDITLAQRHTFIRINPPGGKTTLKGVSLTLRCDASFEGEPVDVDWYYNDVIIPETQPRYTIEMDSNHRDTFTFSILIIVDAVVADSGPYSCRMVSPGRRNAEVKVTILDRPTVITSGDAILVLNRTTRLSCWTTPDISNYPSKIFWHKDGRFVGSRGLSDIDGDETPDVYISPDGKLTILSARTTFAGTYECRIKYQIYARTYYVSGTIVVNALVLIHMETFVWYSASSPYPLTLVCLARGFPYATISWSHRGYTIQGDGGRGNVTIATTKMDHVTMISTLTIQDLPTEFNMTRFTCSAENTLGRDYKTLAVVSLDHVLKPHQRSHAAMHAVSMFCQCLVVCITMDTLVNVITLL